MTAPRPPLPAEHAAVLGIRAATPGAELVVGPGVPAALTERLGAAPAPDPLAAALGAADGHALVVLGAGETEAVTALLDEPRLARATLLLVGTGDAAAREALEALPWGAWPRVRLVDLEHVPPRAVDEGRGHERLHGGLGLVEADAGANEWAGPRPAYVPLARVLPGLRSAALPPRIAAQELDRLRAEHERRVRADAVIAELKASPSWKVTMPLRAAKRAVRRPRP